MSTALDIAASAVGTALALSSQGVQIVSTSPFTIKPDDAFEYPFSNFHTVVRVFRAHLMNELPTVLTPQLQALPLADETTISDVVEAVEAMILAE
jgi:hypothetical protein